MSGQALTLKDGKVQEFKKRDVKISTDSYAFPLVKRKIKCPNYFILKPGCHGFVREPNSLCNKFSESDLNYFKLKNWRFKRDKNGNKIPKWDDYYQPTVSAAFAIEHIWDPKNWVCKHQCRGRCLRGSGGVSEKSVGRLR